MILCIVAAIFVSSCSPKKNTAFSRNYQAFITRYNIYYNGDEHYKETLKEMEKKYEDDYSQTLFVHPAEARTRPKSPQPTGNFDRSIEKAQKAIQLRSIKKRPKKKSGKANDEEYKAWMKRSEYNPFLHNAWMMMGRSQFMNGDFAGAAATFYYVVKHFTWLPNTVTEARIWQARAYICLDWLFEAETIISRIKPEELVNNTLKGLYYLTYSDFYIQSHDNAKAIPMLLETIRYSSGSQKIRLNFLLGQLYSKEGKKKEAYEAFKKAGSSFSAPYRTKFNARIKQSEVYEGTNIEPEVKALKRMTRYDRNKEFLDQIYYAIGNLYISRGDTLNAIENYKLAAEKSTRNGIDRALSQLQLGSLYFDRANYDLAQPCYAEAVPQLPEDYPNYKDIKRRSDVLDEMAVYSQNVTLQDSLLRLAAMDSISRMKVIEKIISDLKKKEKEEAENARREALQAENDARGTGLKDNAKSPTTFNLNTDDSWYFYNTATRNAGKTEFQRKWGSRKLEDDWRRRNKASFSMSDFDTPDDQDDDGDSQDDGQAAKDDGSPTDDKDKAAQDKASDPHNPEYYLNQIPKTEEEIQNANDIIQEGLYNIGVILKDKLAAYKAAENDFNTLLTRYPDNVYRLDVYYNLYMMYMQQGRPDLAEEYRAMILSDFPDSPYAKAMADANFLEKRKVAEEQQEALYAETYQAYIENRNDVVHAAYDRMNRTNPLSKIMPNFMFLHALSYVTENKPDEFNATLKEMLERFPETDMTPMASAYLKGLAQGRKLNSTSTNTRGMLWDTRLLASTDSTGVANDGPIEFTNEPNSPHLFILLYNITKIQPNVLLYDVARFNFNAFTVRDFDLEQQHFGELGLLIVKGFQNQEEANHYRTMLTRDENFKLPEGVRPVVISQANYDMMIRRGASFEEYFTFIGEKTAQETHENVLPPDEYPSAEEMYADPDLRASEQEAPIQDEKLEDDNKPVDEPQPVDEPKPADDIKPADEPVAEPKPAEEKKPVVEPKPADPFDILPPVDETEFTDKPVTEPKPADEPKPVVAEPKPEPTPEPEPAPAPEPKPAPKPEPEPAPAPAPKPEPKPAPKPESKPTPKPQPVVVEPGSEGDDPLLDD